MCDSTIFDGILSKASYVEALLLIKLMVSYVVFLEMLCSPNGNAGETYDLRTMSEAVSAVVEHCSDDVVLETLSLLGQHGRALINCSSLMTRYESTLFFFNCLY